MNSSIEQIQVLGIGDWCIHGSICLRIKGFLGGTLEYELIVAAVREHILSA